jgi:hypothetical protein
MTKSTASPLFDVVPPCAAALSESLRAFGYELPTALADLVDNSLFAKAKNIWINFHWAGGGSAIAIIDDGRGMDENKLREAMRPGSSNPRKVRDPLDLGRFGLGLKTASFSQCRKVTVISRTKGEDKFVRCWDLDHIAQVDEWQLLRTASPLADKLSAALNSSPQGTSVVWEQLDRIAVGTDTENDRDQSSFYSYADEARSHLCLVFHRFLEGPGAAKIWVNGVQVEPWDPFLRKHPAMQDAGQHRPIEKLRCGKDFIEVEPVILPHLSKLGDQAHRLAAGPRGWNLHQGFYVYRNRRLLVPGDWLGLNRWKPEEHYKLARIRIDLPNSLDLQWAIDVTKSKAGPPAEIRDELRRIGAQTRAIAKEVYSRRGARLVSGISEKREFLWEQVSVHGQISYRLNRRHPLVKAAEATTKDKKCLSALFRLIEETIPVPLITITDREQPDQTLGPFEKAKDSDIADVMEQAFSALTTTGYPHAQIISSTEVDNYATRLIDIGKFLAKEPIDVLFVPLRGGLTPSIQLRVINQLSYPAVCLGFTAGSQEENWPRIIDRVIHELEPYRDKEQLSIGIIDAAVSGHGSLALANIIKKAKPHFPKQSWLVGFHLLYASTNPNHKTPAMTEGIPILSESSLIFTKQLYEVPSLVVDDWSQGLGLQITWKGGVCNYRQTGAGQILMTQPNGNVAIIESPQMAQFMNSYIAHQVSILMQADAELTLQPASAQGLGGR